MQFLIDSVIKNGRDLAKKNFWFMLGVMATILAIQGIFFLLISLIRGTIDTETLSLTSNIIINVVSVILGIFINIGWKNINFQMVKNGSASYYQFRNKMLKLFFKFLLAIILYVLIIILLFVLPGLFFYFGSKIDFLMIIAALLFFIAFIFMIILIIRMQFFSYIIIDKGLGGYAALKQSWEITRGHLRELIGFSMVKFVLILFGAMLALIGLLRAIPACEIATADVYKKLTSSTKLTPNSKPILTKTIEKKSLVRKSVKKNK